MTWKALARGAEPEPRACSSSVFHQGARQHYFWEPSGLGNRARLPALARTAFRRDKGCDESGGTSLGVAVGSGSWGWKGAHVKREERKTGQIC